MAGLKTIKTKIVAMKKSQTVTKAMEAVSAAKMRKAQLAALQGRAYARAAAATLGRLSGSRDLYLHPLAAVRKVDRALYIVITSDKGLAGALNSGVLKAAARDIAAQGLGVDAVSVIAVGRKAADYFGSRGYRVDAAYHNDAAITGDVVRSIVAEAANRYAAGSVDRVVVVYQNFVSTFEQRPTLRTLFPLSVRDLMATVADIVPKQGAFAAADEPVAPPAYTLEPSEAEVLGAVLPMLASIVVYHALLESQASEHSARMVAMKSASDKAGEMQGTLTLAFNKARQAAITREVSEITGGMEAIGR